MLGGWRPMEAMVTTTSFDPLSEFAGVWTTRTALHYQSLLDHLFPKWECIAGDIVPGAQVTAEVAWAKSELTSIIGGTASSDDFFLFGPLNLAIQPDTWIQPDVNVLHRIPETAAHRRFVPYDHFSMPIEFVSRSSIQRDKVDKPRLLAAVGVPFYMTVELDQDNRKVRIEQWKLIGDNYKLISTAVNGEVFTMKEPFEVSFPATDLLLPEW